MWYIALLILLTGLQKCNANDNYKVDFDGVPKFVFRHPCQGSAARCGYETNNFASFTLDKDYVDVVVTSLRWSPNDGDGINIRPSWLQGTGIITDIAVVNTTDQSKSIKLRVHAPCQFSVEIGDEDSLFPDEDSYYDFANLLVFINPQVDVWPRQPPSMQSQSQCRSAEKGRTCFVAVSDESCDPLVVPAGQDLWFRATNGPSTQYLWGDGCGDAPKQIVLKQGGRVFLDDDVVVYARILAMDSNPERFNAQKSQLQCNPSGIRKDCGMPTGKDKQTCEAAGCCWSPTTINTNFTIKDTPWCFYKVPSPAPAPAPAPKHPQCDPSGTRIDCGMPTGKDKNTCVSAGCCWSPVHSRLGNPLNGTPWCFHQTSPSPSPSQPPLPSPSPVPEPFGKITGVYGYGVVSNVHMLGHKLGGKVSNVLDLRYDHSEIWGVTVLDSVYRNIQLGPMGRLDWTKSFAWNSETDCINMLSSGGRISNNFFKTNDDCMKAYQRDSVYTGNVIWHQDVGRALMFSWGNLDEAVDTDGSVKFINTSIIHDKLGFRQANSLPSSPENQALEWQAGMMYYSSLINVQHSPTNHIGTSDSPVYIENLHVESRVGSLILITNGYAKLDNKAGWMGTDGCTGSVFMRINGLDLSRVRSIAAPNVAGGCNLDGHYGRIANAFCICTSDQGCHSDQCAVTLTIDNIVDSRQPGVQPLSATLISGDNSHISLSNA